MPAERLRDARARRSRGRDCVRVAWAARARGLATRPGVRQASCLGWRACLRAHPGRRCAAARVSGAPRPVRAAARSGRATRAAAPGRLGSHGVGLGTRRRLLLVVSPAWSRAAVSACRSSGPARGAARSRGPRRRARASVAPRASEQLLAVREAGAVVGRDVGALMLGWSSWISKLCAARGRVRARCSSSRRSGRAARRRRSPSRRWRPACRGRSARRRARGARRRRSPGSSRIRPLSVSITTPRSSRWRTVPRVPLSTSMRRVVAAADHAVTDRERHGAVGALLAERARRRGGARAQRG